MSDNIQPQKITIDGTEYNLDKLSDNAKKQLVHIQFVDNQLQQLNNELAVADTARIGYTNALKGELSKTSDTKVSNDPKNKDWRYRIWIANISDNAKATLASLQFADQHINELKNMSAILQRAKNSYMDSIKKEILAQKAGVLLNSE